MIKSISWAAAAFLFSLLAACGGGGDTVVAASAPTAVDPIVTTPQAPVVTTPSPAPAATVTPPAPAPQPAPTVKGTLPPAPIGTAAPADATITEVQTQEVVTPGESFRIAIGRTTCPVDTNGNCKKQVVLGELGIKTSLKLMNVQFMFDGNLMNGVPFAKDDGYRFFPVGFYSIWRPGLAIEVTAILDPSTPPDTVSAIKLLGTDSNLDETLEVVASSDAKVLVFAQANYAPAQISVLGDGVEPRSFQYACAATAPCQLTQFMTMVSGAPNTQVRLSQGDAMLFEGWTDANGQLAVSTGLAPMYAGQSTKVRVDALGRIDSVDFSQFQSYSGGKLIMPIKPAGCTIVSRDSGSCKG